jgi:FMN hydrolase / 5-amino-6-(5-phospho-D-ribitylamino)uracil phosphatase
VLLLDVMGTLVFDPFYERVPAFFEMTFEQLLRQKHPTAWIEFELGQIDEATFLPRFFRDGRSYDHEGLKATMRGNYAWLPGMEDLVAELAGGGCELHAFSNYTPWYQMIEQRTTLSRFVHWSFVSCDTGLRKPDHTAYTNAAGSLGVAPEACLFVDDRPRNCDAAIEVGMPSIVFESAEQLRRELIARGVLQS